MADTLTPSRDIGRLIEIMAALRTPKTGCPWDLEQSFETIAPYTIEEAYEVADAIARRDLVDLKDELGDLLLQVVYHARIAEEQGAFAFGDVVEAVTKKMIRRHPHVFGDGTARDPSAVKATWDQIKAEERAEKAAERGGASSSNPSPESRDSSHIGRRSDHAPCSDARRQVAGQSRQGRLRLAEPSARVREAEGRDRRVRGSGAPLRSSRRPARRRGVVEAPSTKNSATCCSSWRTSPAICSSIPRPRCARPIRNSSRRFAHIERAPAERGKSPSQSSLAEMDALWDEAKVREKA